MSENNSIKSVLKEERRVESIWKTDTYGYYLGLERGGLGKVNFISIYEDMGSAWAAVFIGGILTARVELSGWTIVYSRPLNMSRGIN